MFKHIPVRIFADGANMQSMIALNENPMIDGFTTNPTLMRKAGVTNYEEFAVNVLKTITEKPISFEVFSDNLQEMRRQAEKIASWGENVYVKIPITDTKGNSLVHLIGALLEEGIKVNVTAIFTKAQTHDVINAVDVSVHHEKTPVILSIFAGRVADLGIEPGYHFDQCRRVARAAPHVQLLWASPRQVYDLILAEQSGANIITMTPEMLAKVPLLGSKTLSEYSRETVKMFYDDAQAAGFTL